MREQERRQVVDRETELVSVGARLAPAMPPTTADPGVVHEHVEPRLVALDLAGETAHRLERREVGPVDAQPVVARSLADLLGRARQPVRAAAVEQHGRTARGQVLRQRPAEPVGGAGDEDRLLVEGTHPGNRMRRSVAPRKRPLAPSGEISYSLLARMAAAERYIIQVERPGERIDMAAVRVLLGDTGVELDADYGPVPVNPKLGRYVVRGLASPDARARAEAIPGVRFFAEVRQEPA